MVRHDGAWTPLRLAIAGIFVVAAATACVPLYLPPVPASLPPLGDRTRITDVGVTVASNGLVTVQMEVEEVAEEGWLAVQWFGPAGAARASEARWISRDVVPVVARFVLPDRVDLRPAGRWRVVVTYGRDVVAQREWNVDAP